MFVFFAVVGVVGDDLMDELGRWLAFESMEVYSSSSVYRLVINSTYHFIGRGGCWLLRVCSDEYVGFIAGPKDGRYLSGKHLLALIHLNCIRRWHMLQRRVGLLKTGGEGTCGDDGQFGMGSMMGPLKVSAYQS